jgi:hypothetical protein
MAEHAVDLVATVDSDSEFNLVTRVPSPFPQHKGHPMWFGAVRIGKAYVSYHLMPLYMCAELNAKISPALKKRMQGKTCFNFKKAPDAELLDELRRLTADSVASWREKRWL